MHFHIFLPFPSLRDRLKTISFVLIINFLKETVKIVSLSECSLCSTAQHNTNHESFVPFLRFFCSNFTFHGKVDAQGEEEGKELLISASLKGRTQHKTR